MDRARVLVPGSDVTVLCYGPMVRTCAEAAVAAARDGRSLEVIDLRSLAPLDTETIFTSVRKTGRCVIVHEAVVTGGIGAEIAARVTQECFYSLEARCCASAPTPRRIRRPGWRSTTSLTWIGSWTRSTAPSATERAPCQISRSSSSLMSEKA